MLRRTVWTTIGLRFESINDDKNDDLYKSSPCLIPPLHRGCNLCASPVRPQNWPGCRWRHRGGRNVALVVQGWHRGRSDIAMNAMVAVKFWACSKQSHKGRRGGRSLRRKAHTSPWSQNGCTLVGHWSPRKKCALLWTLCINLSDASAFPDCTTTVPPYADRWRPLSDHCGDHCASIRRPQQPLSHHNNGSTSTLPPLCDLLRHYSSFGRSGKAQWSCCNSYTER